MRKKLSSYFSNTTAFFVLIGDLLVPVCRYQRLRSRKPPDRSAYAILASCSATPARIRHDREPTARKAVQRILAEFDLEGHRSSRSTVSIRASPKRRTWRAGVLERLGMIATLRHALTCGRPQREFLCGVLAAIL